MARKLFGTDGVRGVAGEELTAELALALGRAGRAQVRQRASPGAGHPRHPRVGRDARVRARRRGERGRRRSAARRGAADAGRAAADRPLRLRPGGRDLGLAQPLPATTASSSSAATATSSPTRQELEIERDLERPGPATRRRAGPIRPAGCASCTAPARTTCASSTPASTSSTWAASTWCSTAPTAPPTSVAPEIFRRLGATVTVLADEPDGRNINDGCGSTHIERLRGHRASSGAHDLGFAFDGDGDRVLAVDREGEVVDGDELLALAALHLRAGGRLAGDGVAVTVMTNYGFHSAMARGRDRGRRHGGRRPLRARGAARARLDARRRAVRSHHRVVASTAPATASPARC